MNLYYNWMTLCGCSHGWTWNSYILGNNFWNTAGAAKPWPNRCEGGILRYLKTNVDKVYLRNSCSRRLLRTFGGGYYHDSKFCVLDIGHPFERKCPDKKPGYGPWQGLVALGKICLQISDGTVLWNFPGRRLFKSIFARRKPILFPSLILNQLMDRWRGNMVSNSKKLENGRCPTIRCAQL